MPPAEPGSIEMLALRFQQTGRRTGLPDVWIVASEQEPSGRYLAAVLLPRGPVVQWFTSAAACDEFVVSWGKMLTAEGGKFVGTQQEQVSLAGSSDKKWASALREKLDNAEPRPCIDEYLFGGSRSSLKHYHHEERLRSTVLVEEEDAERVVWSDVGS